ncbi:MAG TPA: hypothetical protein PLT87_00230 [Spirochaetales bacterium]|nr:hypothetical protein [Spirochaetales bacterium]
MLGLITFGVLLCCQAKLSGCIVPATYGVVFFVSLKKSVLSGVGSGSSFFWSVQVVSATPVQYYHITDLKTYLIDNCRNRY